MYAAGENGHLELLQWLGTPEGGNCRPRGGANWFGVINNGHLHVLKELHLYGVRFTTEYACMLAAVGGHLEVLKWLRFIGCPWNGSVLECARLFNHWELLAWAIENGCPN